MQGHQRGILVGRSDDDHPVFSTLRTELRRPEAKVVVEQRRVIFTCITHIHTCQTRAANDVQVAAPRMTTKVIAFSHLRTIQILGMRSETQILRH